MDKEVKKIFELYQKTTMTSDEWDKIEAAVNLDDGTSFLENDYLQIEYHNKIGYEKAKMLIAIFDDNKTFYQHFLKKIERIVIKDNYQANSNEIVINNRPTSISIQNLLEQIFPNYPECFGALLEKLTYKEARLKKEEILSFLKGKILRDKVSKKEIDFFKYLDLMKGKFVNEDIIYDEAIIDIAFEYSNMQMLDDYINKRNLEDIKNNIFWTLAQKYNVALFNESLAHQSNLFDKKNDFFLSNNMMALFNLFSEKCPLIQQRQSSESKEKINMNKDETLKLVLEFLYEIDKTNNLVKELIENTKNNKIIIWNPNDTEQVKKMQEQYSEKFDVFIPQCITFFKDNKIQDVIMNVPLTHTIDDILTIIHEFFHFHSSLKSLTPQKSPALGEFLSIYYEMYVCEFLIKKGYSQEKITNLFNFRIEDTISNYIYSAPIIFWLNQYKTKGQINFEDVLFLTKEQTELVKRNLIETGLDDEEITKQMEGMGYHGDLNITAHQLIFNMNNLLLTQDESVFERYPYILGTILAYESFDKKIDSKYLLELSDLINDIKDPYEVLETLGIDMKKYGFIRSGDTSLLARNNHLKH